MLSNLSVPKFMYVSPKHASKYYETNTEYFNGGKKSRVEFAEMVSSWTPVGQISPPGAQNFTSYGA